VEAAEYRQIWLLNESREQMVRRTITVVPALYKIFDEILVNAADNRQRDPQNCDTIKVDIDRELGEIAIFNNGRAIPVQIHNEHGCYVPELIFGHLLTSSNYDDDQKKTTGGRNGYGAKLTNIYSSKFTVETNDTQSGKFFKQVGFFRIFSILCRLEGLFGLNDEKDVPEEYVGKDGSGGGKSANWKRLDSGHISTGFREIRHDRI